jgi:hypothetical protein
VNTRIFQAWASSVESFTIDFPAKLFSLLFRNMAGNVRLRGAFVRVGRNWEKKWPQSKPPQKPKPQAARPSNHNNQQCQQDVNNQQPIKSTASPESKVTTQPCLKRIANPTQQSS